MARKPPAISPERLQRLQTMLAASEEQNRRARRFLETLASDLHNDAPVPPPKKTRRKPKHAS